MWLESATDSASENALGPAKSWAQGFWEAPTAVIKVFNKISKFLYGLPNTYKLVASLFISIQMFSYNRCFIIFYVHIKTHNVLHLLHPFHVMHRHKPNNSYLTWKFKHFCNNFVPFNTSK